MVLAFAYARLGKANTCLWLVVGDRPLTPPKRKGKEKGKEKNYKNYKKKISTSVLAVSHKMTGVYVNDFESKLAEYIELVPM